MAEVSGFLPSTSAALFSNGPWAASTRLRIPIPGLPDIGIDTSRMGFCGGMSFIARDIFEAGRPQLRGTDSTAVPGPVVDVIQRRLRDSFGGPATVARWLRATAEPDGQSGFGAGLFADTVAECAVITSMIDAGKLCPIGLVLTRSPAPWAVFDNHVELVYGYQRSGSLLRLQVYDSNHPGDDSIEISLDTGPDSPGTIDTNGTSGTLGVRGLLALGSYRWADPAPLYLDDARVQVTVPAAAESYIPGLTLRAEVSVTNTGSTTWSAAEGYRLGSAGPRDNRAWGLQRVELDRSVDPGEQYTFSFDATVPDPLSEEQAGFCWQMVREHVQWFGAVSAPLGLALSGAGQ
ncbi:hypothetical protein M6D93_14970 [Jatrophihabitans telluris]|uniref:Uncharacterized protein n=1 Tax=Jatrophihabitans telluris TaxID=2038343 RepID=A0ABY4QXE8_9ACTN|nr:hypothetical protein [Jatrophihabitans telluris]UQX87594.1 hypothetical protein M6D93_14970 [Jatrophihabitans telluris]